MRVKWGAWSIALVLLATAALYLGYVALLGAEIGYPVDDAWIHQTLARNLVQYGEFAYNRGEPSTASTSPLWTLMLAAGYLLPGAFRYLAYALGLLFLGLTSWVGYLLSRRLFPEHPRVAVLAGAAVLLEWHLSWAALSGMETVLFAFSCLLLIYLAVSVLQEGPSPARVGLLGAAAGFATLVRPEGLGLGILALAAVALRWGNRRRLALALGVWLALLLPLAVYNVVVGGTPLPSTFYAKHSAYAQALDPVFVVSYIGRAIGTLAEGPLILLLPGVAYVFYRVIGWLAGRALPSTPLAAGEGRKRAPLSFREKVSLAAGNPFLLIGAWIVGLVGLYMWRLPALFHHGRYLMPLLPLLLVIGVGGLAWLAQDIPYRLAARVYFGLAALMFLALWVNGAVVFGWDVKFIGDEEVETAKWLNENVPAGTVIATHDIGAIGYFAEMRIVDTAGLITPELGPYVKDQVRILGYLEAKQVGYLAIFPKWYPRIVADPRFEEVFRVDQPYAVPAGADNMVVYRIRW